MCRMVGAVFRGDFPMGSLTDLRHVAEVGRIPGEELPGHRDGWGIVSFQNGSPRYIGRSPREAFLDPSFDSALDDVSKIKAPNILIAHVRALSKGEAILQNTHPFVADGIVLAHNGTVKNFGPPTRHKPKGDTDSELLLARLADRMQSQNDLKASLQGLIREDILTHEYTAAILLVSDGQRLYAYRDFSPGRSAEYYDLKMSECDDCIVLFQETFLGYSGSISQIRNGELVSIGLNLDVEREAVR